MPPPPVFVTVEGLELIMSRAGFADIRVLTEMKEFVYPNEESFWATLWSTAIRGSLERIEKTSGPDGLEGLKVAVYEQLRALRQDDGIHQSFSALFTLGTKP